MSSNVRPWWKWWHHFCLSKPFGLDMADLKTLLHSNVAIISYLGCHWLTYFDWCQWLKTLFCQREPTGLRWHTHYSACWLLPNTLKLVNCWHDQSRSYLRRQELWSPCRRWLPLLLVMMHLDGKWWLSDSRVCVCRRDGGKVQRVLPGVIGVQDVIDGVKGHHHLDIITDHCMGVWEEVTTCSSHVQQMLGTQVSSVRRLTYAGTLSTADGTWTSWPERSKGVWHLWKPFVYSIALNHSTSIATSPLLASTVLPIWMLHIPKEQGLRVLQLNSWGRWELK